MHDKPLYRGSVKDVYKAKRSGASLFVFSDRYSIFDWGEMPDLLPQKGEALAVMGDLLFRFLGSGKNWQGWSWGDAYPDSFSRKLEAGSVWQRLRSQGVDHHSLGLVDQEENALPVGKLSNRLLVQALPRLLPRQTEDGWDYSEYEGASAPLLVPLEVVFRFGATPGSSFLSRLEAIPSYASTVGFPKKPRADELFPFPIVEFFTKLEPTDRFLPRSEAKEVAGLIEEELQALEQLTLLLALRLRDVFAAVGLELWDGKLEFAFVPGEKGERRFALVDSIGPDELRLLHEGVHFSKEILRKHYRNSDWYRAVEEAKQLAKIRNVRDWRKICAEELRQSPLSLPAPVFAAARDLYPALTRDLGKELFSVDLYPEAPSVKTAARSLAEIS